MQSAGKPLQNTSVSSPAGKSLRHQVFPGGPPSKYYPGPTMLNFRDQTRKGYGRTHETCRAPCTQTNTPDHKEI